MRSRLGSTSGAFFISAVFISLAGCSAGGTQPGVSSHSNGGSGGSGGATSSAGGSGNGVVVDGSASGGTGGASWIGKDLPSPWQYYDEGSDRAYKDPRSRPG